MSIKDAKFLYYAHALDLTPEDSATLATVLGPLTSVEDSEPGNLLTAARSLSADLNGDGVTNAEDAAVLYYSFALEASLGNGTDTKPGIEEIKKAILGPLTGTGDDMATIDAMLQRVYDVVREPELQDAACSGPENQEFTQSCINRLKVRKITKL